MASRVVIHKEGLAMESFSKFHFSLLKMVKSSSVVLVKKRKNNLFKVKKKVID